MSDAAAALLRDPAGLLLMGRPNYRDDGLLLPGAGVEPGEHPAEAAAREVGEETGLVVTIGRLLVVERIDPDGLRGGSRRRSRRTPMMHPMFGSPRPHADRSPAVSAERSAGRHGRGVSPLHETVRLSVELDVAVEDRVAAASFLLAAVRDAQGGIGLPAASTLERQVAQIVDEAIRDCLRADQGVTGLRIDELRVRAVPSERA